MNHDKILKRGAMERPFSVLNRSVGGTTKFLPLSYGLGAAID
jgi:hypothetical protein